MSLLEDFQVADRDWQLYYGGAWQPSQAGNDLPVFTPIDGRQLAVVPAADGEDVSRAVAAAAVAGDTWGRTTVPERIAAVRRVIAAVREHAEELAQLDTVTAGLPISSMRQEVTKTLDVLEYYIGIAHELKGMQHLTSPDYLAYTRREPYGVVGQIYPFNHPLMFTLLGLAPALLAGNSVVVKPADQAPLSNLALGAILGEVLPPGLFNVISGRGPEAGAALSAHPGVKRIAFIGSVRGGQAVLAASAGQVKHVSLELGGKNPLLVLDDADVDAAVAIAVRGMNLRGGAGQSCQSNSRILLPPTIADDFSNALVAAVRAIKVGDPRDEATEMGPLAFRQHYERVCGYIAAGVDAGVTLLTGGGRPDGLDQGYYLEPTVFAGVRPGMSIADEEIFGPVMSIIECANDDEMVQVANSLPYGLTARIAGSIERALPLIGRLQAGTVWVNEPNYRPLGMPVGGYKHSGLGTQTCVSELLSYTQEKGVVIGV
jgi:acyl-CoA reductase-like NAD-dependent aldehyde dehydrogenase